MAILHRMRASVPIAPATFFRTATIILIVATIAMVPPLVRATARPGADTSSPIRLNRGFQQPPSKCIVVPPADAPPQSVQHLMLPTQVNRFDAPRDESLPDSARSPSLDPLRGPPVLPLS
jgi:hypothetical protein